MELILKHGLTEAFATRQDVINYIDGNITYGSEHINPYEPIVFAYGTDNEKVAMIVMGLPEGQTCSGKPYYIIETVDVGQVTEKLEEIQTEITALQQTVENLGNKIDTVKTDLQNGIDNIATASGLTKEEGSNVYKYVPTHASLGQAKSIGEGLENLAEVVENLPSATTLAKKDTNTVKINVDKTEGKAEYVISADVNVKTSASTNIIGADTNGILAKADLSYDKDNKKITFTRSGYDENQQFVDEAKKVEIDLTSAVSSDYEGDDGQSTGVCVNVDNEQHTISAKILLSTDPDDNNLLELIDGEYVVKGYADNIRYAHEQCTVEDKLYDLNQKISHITGYDAGDGLQLVDNKMSVKKDSEDEGYLTVSANGVKVTGVNAAIQAADTKIRTDVNAAIEQVSTQVITEKQRATAAEQSIRNDVDATISGISSALNSEITRATNKENEILGHEGAGATEKSVYGAFAAINDVNTTVTQEKERAEQAEQQIRADVNAAIGDVNANIGKAIQELDSSDVAIAVDSSDVIGLYGVKEENGVIAQGTKILDLAKVAKTGKSVDVAFGQSNVGAELTKIEGDETVNGSIKKAVKDAIDALDATVSQTAGADGLSLTVNQTDGKITSISGSIEPNKYDAYGAADQVQSTVSAYTVNGKKISETPVLTGADMTIGGTGAHVSANMATAIEDIYAQIGTGGTVDDKIASAINSLDVSPFNTVTVSDNVVTLKASLQEIDGKISNVDADTVTLSAVAKTGDSNDVKYGDSSTVKAEIQAIEQYKINNKLIKENPVLGATDIEYVSGSSVYAEIQKIEGEDNVNGSIKKAVKDAQTTLEGKISDVDTKRTIIPMESSTIALSKNETTSGTELTANAKISSDNYNALTKVDSGNQGLYVAAMDISYESTTNTLTITKGGVVNTIKLAGVSAINNMAYDPTTHTLTLYYTVPDTNEQKSVTIDLTGLIPTIIGSAEGTNEPIKIVVTESTEGGVYKAVISAQITNYFTADLVKGTYHIEGEGDVYNVDAALQHICTKLLKVLGDIAELQTTVNLHTTTITELQTKVTAAEGNITNLTTRMGSAEGNITTLQTNVTTLNNDVSDLKAEVGNTPVSTQITEKIATLNGNATIASVSDGAVTLKSGIIETNGIVANNSGSDITLKKIATTGSASDVTLADSTTVEATIGTLKNKVGDKTVAEQITSAISDLDAGTVPFATLNSSTNVITIKGGFHETDGKVVAETTGDIPLAAVATTGKAKDVTLQNGTDLETALGEAGKVENIKVNGVEGTVTNKIAEVTIDGSKIYVDETATTKVTIQQNFADIENKLGNTPVSEQIATEIGKLDAASVGGTGSYLQTIVENDGVITASAQAFDTTLNATSDNNAPTGKAVATYVSDEIGKLDAASVGSTGSYLQTIVENNGVITASAQAFDTTLNATSDDNAPTGKAVATYVSDEIGKLDAASVGGTGSYLQTIVENDGVITANAQAFDTTLNATSDDNAPTGKAVATYVSDEIGKLEVTTAIPFATISNNVVTIKSGVKETGGKIVADSITANDITLAAVAKTGQAKDVTIDADIQEPTTAPAYLIPKSGDTMVQIIEKLLWRIKQLETQLGTKPSTYTSEETVWGEIENMVDAGTY